MVAKNDVTGDSIQSKAPNESYLNNFDLIFRKNKQQVDESHAPLLKQEGIDISEKNKK